MDNETTWPSDVLEYIEHHHDLFQAWELIKCGVRNLTVNVPQYDVAIYGLRDILKKYSLHGYHCTRLIESEAQCIMSNGLQLPNERLLHDRIRQIEQSGVIDPKIADRLRKEKQATEIYRTDMIWFCFYPPRLAGQRGIERFFRNWGGEALYNSHEDDALTGPVLKGLGTPCLFEVKVPIVDLAIPSWLEDKIIRRFLMKRGLETNECVDHDGRATRPIMAQNIIRLIQFPNPDFVKLTGCDTWSPTLA